MSKKIVVANREEALKLIGEGVKSILIFSDEAPHGYKKDGSPAAPRGRKPLDPEKKAAREAKRAASTRKKPGPVVRTPDAPFGVNKNGEPMKKRGRPRKNPEATLAPVAPVAPVTEVKVDEAPAAELAPLAPVAEDSMVPAVAELPAASEG